MNLLHIISAWDMLEVNANGWDSYLTQKTGIEGVLGHLLVSFFL